MGRDVEVKQRQHFYHNGDTICHPKSGYVTTKLRETSTCRRNNNAIFSDRAIFTFPTGRVGVDYKSPITITVPIKLSITIMITVVIEKAITITITVTCLPWKRF